MNSPRTHAVVLTLICAVMFWWRLGHLGLIDPDEPFYAQTTREMVETNDWVVPHIFGKPQFEKPVFFYWQTAVAQKIFGENEFAARFPSAFFATALVFLTWIFGRRLLSDRAGFLSAVIMATGIEFALMARLMLTDISLAFFITASLGCFWMALHDKKNRGRWIFWQLVASGFASLTKGPIGLLFPLLGGGSFLLFAKRNSPWHGRGFWLGALAWLVIAVPWYAVMLMKFGREYWDLFFVHENWERLVRAEHPHNNHFWYYPMILAVGSLPWMPLMVSALMRWRDMSRDRAMLFLACWFVPNLIFLCIVQSKLPSYIFFLFVPMALVMGRVLDSILQSGFRSRGERLAVSIVAIVQAVGLLAAPHIRPEAEKYGWLAGIIAIPLSIAALLMVLQRFKLATVATVVASAFIVGIALTKVGPDVESKTSTRDIGKFVGELRRPDEPVVTASFLSRAVLYYSHITPARELAQGAQAHFSPHPLQVVIRDKGLAEFARDYPSVLCVTQRRDIEDLTRPKSVLRNRIEELRSVGEGHDARVIFRVLPEAKSGAN